jgi:hypothetical protein
LLITLGPELVKIFLFPKNMYAFIGFLERSVLQANVYWCCEQQMRPRKTAMLHGFKKKKAKLTSKGRAAVLEAYVTLLQLMTRWTDAAASGAERPHPEYDRSASLTSQYTLLDHP